MYTHCGSLLCRPMTSDTQDQLHILLKLFGPIPPKPRSVATAPPGTVSRSILPKTPFDAMPPVPLAQVPIQPPAPLPQQVPMPAQVSMVKKTSARFYFVLNLVNVMYAVVWRAYNPLIRCVSCGAYWHMCFKVLCLSS